MSANADTPKGFTKQMESFILAAAPVLVAFMIQSRLSHYQLWWLENQLESMPFASTHQVMALYRRALEQKSIYTDSWRVPDTPCNIHFY